MKYKIRTGISLVEICDEYMLIAGKNARKYCPKAAQINETAAFIWKQISLGKTEEQISDAVGQEYEVENVEPVIREYIQSLEENGYLITEE